MSAGGGGPRQRGPGRVFPFSFLPPPPRARPPPRPPRAVFLFSFLLPPGARGPPPPADMRWMRFYDRTLWYVLQNFGRQGAYAEGGAVHVHYLYEIKSGEPLVEPQLDKAISALE